VELVGKPFLPTSQACTRGKQSLALPISDKKATPGAADSFDGMESILCGAGAGVATPKPTL